MKQEAKRREPLEAPGFSRGLAVGSDHRDE
jgi:hypothetical protein